ncbi:TetR/AcrR family transcriptional regulator [Rhodococcus olei]|uniref:TetR/AcrR family transcriptional regulator n=1 Tax=Rhodococcus olei TaxID=2161675 RepID=UPI0031EF061D
MLLEAAALFQEKGFAAASTRELGDRLGLRGASIYYHFKSKEELLYRIYVRSMTTIRERVDEVIDPALPAKERLRAMAHRHVVTVLTNRDLHSPIDLQRLAPEWRADILRRRREYEQLFLDQIAAAQNDGTLRSDISAEMLMLSLFNLMNWTILWYSPNKDQAADDLAEAFFTVFLEGTQAAPACGQRK